MPGGSPPGRSRAASPRPAGGASRDKRTGETASSPSGRRSRDSRERRRCAAAIWRPPRRDRDQPTRAGGYSRHHGRGRCGTRAAAPRRGSPCNPKCPNPEAVAARPSRSGDGRVSAPGHVAGFHESCSTGGIWKWLVPEHFEPSGPQAPTRIPTPEPRPSLAARPPASVRQAPERLPRRRPTDRPLPRAIRLRRRLPVETSCRPTRPPRRIASPQGPAGQTLRKALGTQTPRSRDRAALASRRRPRR